MSQTDEKLTRVTICMPTEIAAATQKAAAKEFTTVSHVCRQAIVHDLRKRGWLSDPETVGQPQN